MQVCWRSLLDLAGLSPLGRSNSVIYSSRPFSPSSSLPLFGIAAFPARQLGRPRRRHFTPTPIFDYILYLGSLVWCVELAYLENRFHVLSGQWDLYLLATALLFFFLAYRFDNRFVLSLALSSLAGWFGLTISHWPSHQDAAYRQYALLYCLLVGIAGAILQRLKLKSHFFTTYLNVAANVLFWAIVSGVFDSRDYGLWLVGLLIACAASLVWGLERRQFAFVAYAAVYGYVGVSWMLLRNASDTTFILAYFVLTAIAMIVMLVQIARRFGGGRSENLRNRAKRPCVPANS